MNTVSVSLPSEQGSKEVNSSQYRKACILCDGSHHLDDCPHFIGKHIEEWKDIIRTRALCFGCLKQHHNSKDCRGKLRCRKCNKLHPTSFHLDNFTMSAKIETTDGNQKVKGKAAISSATCSSSHTGRMTGQVKYSVIVLVWVGNDQKKVQTYALLDTQSDSSFLLDSICAELGVTGPKTNLSLSTMYAQDTVVEIRTIRGLTVRA